MPANETKANRNVFKAITDRILTLLIEEANKSETQKQIRQRIVVPLITILYNELHPYIIALSCIMIAVLSFSALTFIGFILYYLRNL